MDGGEIPQGGHPVNSVDASELGAGTGTTIDLHRGGVSGSEGSFKG